MREIKFRAWNKTLGLMLHLENFKMWPFEVILENENFVLLQFTGLHEKNGKEVYEGDIVLDWEGIDRYTVVWNEHWACFELDRITHMNDTTQEIDGTPFDLEVIGNIYENPELLKTN